MTYLEDLPPLEKLAAVDRALFFHRTMPFGLHQTPGHRRAISQLDDIRDDLLDLGGDLYSHPEDAQ